MRPRVVICGSFHRDLPGLRLLYRELETTGCRILSPISLDFSDTSQPVMSAQTEKDLSVEELEKFHLRAIRDADFIWLHAPNGHVGISGSYELGYAAALGITVFTKATLQDEMLRTRVCTANSVFEALEAISST